MYILKVTPINFILSFLVVTLSIVILAIAYRKLLSHLGKGKIAHKDFCVLYALENSKVKNDLELYFTSEFVIDVEINLLDEHLKLLENIYHKAAKVGGNIVRKDVSHLPGGQYFYELKTAKQRTMKKFTIVKNS